MLDGSSSRLVLSGHGLPDCGLAILGFWLVGGFLCGVGVGAAMLLLNDPEAQPAHHARCGASTRGINNLIGLLKDVVEDPSVHRTFRAVLALVAQHVLVAAGLTRGAGHQRCGCW